MRGIESGIGRRNQSAFRAVDRFLGNVFGCVSVVETAPDIRVTAIEARLGYCLVITYADGREIAVDLSDVVRRGGAFKPLQDERLFSLAQVNRSGDGIEWPEPRDERGEPLIGIDAASIYRAYDQAAAGIHKRTA
jgi:hypothetical protein